jgi:hypothetical protein
LRKSKAAMYYRLCGLQAIVQYKII